MGQFFQSADRKYIDFMYKPNLELLEKVARESANDKYLSAKLLDAVDDVKFDYLDYDAELAKEKQDYYNQKVDELSEIAANSNNPNDYKLKLKELERELYQDFKQGDINNFYKQLKAKKDFDDKLLLMTPEEQNIYGNMWNDFKERNNVNRKDGKYGDIFKPDQMYSIRNFEDEFLKSNHFKNLKSELRADDIIKKDGTFMMRQGSNIQELPKNKIINAWKAFMRENLTDDYAKTMSKYRGENDWFNEMGELDFEGGRIKRMGDEIANIAHYKNVKNNMTPVSNSSANHHNRGNNIYTGRNTQGAISGLPIGSQKLNTEHLEKMKSIIYTKNRFLDEIRNIAPVMKDIHDFQDALDKLESVKKAKKDFPHYDLIKNKILKYKNSYENGINISYSALAEYIGEKAAKQFRDNVKESVNNRGGHIKGFLNIHTLPDDVQKFFIDNNIDYTSITPNQLNYLPEGYTVKVQKNSSELQLVKELLNDPKAHSVVTTLIFEDLNGKTFTGDIFYPLTSVTGDAEIATMRNSVLQ